MATPLIVPSHGLTQFFKTAKQLTHSPTKRGNYLNCPKTWFETTDLKAPKQCTYSL